MSLNQHDEVDGVPASPAQEGTPDNKGVKPAAVLGEQEGILSNPGAHIDQLQAMQIQSAGLAHHSGVKVKLDCRQVNAQSAEQCKIQLSTMQHARRWLRVEKPAFAAEKLCRQVNKGSSPEQQVQHRSAPR